MSEAEPQARTQVERPRLGHGLKAAMTSLALLGVAASLYAIVASCTKQGGDAGLQSLAQGDMAKLTVPPAGTSYPPTTFVDADGKPVHLADFKGKALVVNFWATWCAPCVKEMPTLAALQAAYAGKPLKVVAISMDQAAQTEEAKAFIAKHAPLGFYQDAKYAFLSDLKPHLPGFPTTVLFDREGNERGFMAGEANWSGSDAKAVMDKLISE
jgi:thiol-disulfide isomerase/thioredoxin